MFLHCHEDSELGKIIISTNLFSFFLGGGGGRSWSKKAPKWTQNEVSQVLWQIEPQNIPNFLHEFPVA